MLGGSYPLFRVGGTLLQVHLTFPLLLAFVAWQGWQAGGSGGAAASVLFILILFVCVVLHEFGHVEAARRYGIRTPTVTLTPLGGIAALERMPEKPGQEIVVALAGPAVTLAIAIVLYLFLGFAIDLASLNDTQADLYHLAARVAVANVALLVFNLIPAFPMDGGRVLRGALTYWLGHAKATRIAARIGQAFALGLAALALFYVEPLLLLVSIFIFLAAEGELRHVQRRVEGSLGPDVLMTNLRMLSASDTAAGLAAMLDETSQPIFPITDGGKRIVGTVTRTRLAEAWASGAGGAKVEALMRPGLPVIKASTPLHDAYSAVMASDADLVGVVDDSGGLRGFLSKEHLLSMSPTRGRRRPTGPLIRP